MSLLSTFACKVLKMMKIKFYAQIIFQFSKIILFEQLPGFSCGSPDESVLKYVGLERVPKVRGGHCMEQGAVPWTVQIQVKEFGRYTHRCGGSLISDKHVITASHCFRALVDKDILVILAQNDFTNDNDPGEVAFQVEKFWLHERFQ